MFIIFLWDECITLTKNYIKILCYLGHCTIVHLPWKPSMCKLQQLTLTPTTIFVHQSSGWGGVNRELICGSLSVCSVCPSVWESCNLLWLFILRKVYIVTGMFLCQVCHGMLQRGSGTLWELLSLCELLCSRQFLSLFSLAGTEIQHSYQ